MSIFHSSLKAMGHWFSALGEASLCRISMERAARISPEWGRHESKSRIHPSK